MTDDDEVICIVHNIPKTFHARDLRNYFSQFLEKGAFTIFHYRHRPEVQQVQSEASRPMTGVGNTTPETASAEPGAELITPPSGQVNTAGKSRRSHVACCATLKLPRRHLAEFLSLYDRKHWVDSSGSYLSRRCFISRLRLPSTANAVSVGGSGGGGSGEVTTASAEPTTAAAQLDSMIEFRPPADMPRGNVGTPTAYFLDEIQKCRLPASLVKRLGLVFPRSARRRQYSTVPMDYGTGPVSSDDAAEEEDAKTEEDGEVRTASGAELLHRLPSKPTSATASSAVASTAASSSSSTASADTEEEKLRVPASSAASTEEEKQPAPNPPRASDETDAEETDRHEALHNDVTSQDRTKERLYEEEIELVWEKGGPGLVWYTDAVFWDQQRGDFDERTADDWDVDMSGYEPGLGPGDMDARESREMRRELRLRAGEEEESAFERGRQQRAPGHRRGRRDRDGSDSDGETGEIGAFDRHTRGFGRRVLLNLGWSEGRGLGAGQRGIAEPIPNTGQTDRRGFGFIGERLERRPQRRKAADSAPGVITTAYSDPRETELPEETDTSLPPTHMKFRRRQQ